MLGPFEKITFLCRTPYNQPDQTNGKWEAEAAVHQEAAALWEAARMRVQEKNRMGEVGDAIKCDATTSQWKWRGRVEDGQQPRKHMLPRFLMEGAKVLLRRLPASTIYNDNGPTSTRTLTVPPHHLCCHAAAQVVAAGLGQGITAARNSQQPIREQEGCRERKWHSERQWHWKMWGKETSRYKRWRSRGACRLEAAVWQEAAQQPTRGQ